MKIYVQLVTIFFFPIFLSAQLEIVEDAPDYGQVFAIDAYDNSRIAFSAQINNIHFKTAGTKWDTIWMPGETAYDLQFISEELILAGTGQGNIYKVNLSDKSRTLVFSDTAKTKFINYIEIFKDGTGIAMGDGKQYYPVILKTENWGDTWEIIQTPELGYSGDTWRRLDFINTEIGYFQPSGNDSLPRGIYKTTDGGLSWNQVDSNIVMNLKFFDESIGLYYDDGDIKRTLNGGETWELMDSLDDMGWGHDFEFLPGDPSKVWFTNGDLYYSSDTGATWQRYNEETFPDRSSFMDIIFIDSHNGFVLGENGLLLKTNNNGNISSGYFGNNYKINNKNFLLDVHSNGEFGKMEGNFDEGTYKGMKFLWAGGFLLSGFNKDSLWAAGGAIFDKVDNFISGPINQSDEGIWVIKSTDEAFSKSWLAWKDAVSLGADFWDGDGDGIYNPIDLNGDGLWNENEDAPDIMGDETIWTIYNDGVPEADRDRYDGVKPLGIEIKQTVYSYYDEVLNNALFIRYIINNTGLVSDTLKDVIFSPFNDPDIGDATDDLMGIDTVRRSLLVYNYGNDDNIESAPPALMIPILNGPVKYIPGETFTDINGNDIYDEGIDVPLDSAQLFRGELLGTKIIPGAKNLLPTSNMLFIGSDPDFGDPDDVNEARNFMEGKNRFGEYIDPCTYPYANVKAGVNCGNVNPLFLASGDPVKQTGWINTESTDLRTILNTGTFDLIKDEPVEILIAYVIGQGTDEINSIEVVREYVDYIHEFVGNDIVVSVDGKRTSTTPSNYSLSQNYPNPFNPSTKISFSIPKRSNVQLKIFDILGREVSTLMNEEKTTGSYEVIFNASKLSSGIYFYQLKSGNFIETKKMTLIK